MLRGEGGQAVVEAALVLPSLVFLLLGAVQLTQLQQARVLADYAVFAAARAGIVMNGDPGKMRDAAALAILPAFGAADSLAALGKTLLRFKAEEALLEPFGLQRLRIEVHNPAAADFARYGQHLHGKELDFDDVRPGATEATLLSLRLRYLYELKVPFANKLFQALWIAARGKMAEGAPVAGLLAAARRGRYYLPLQAFYTMRMQSNPYLKWARK
jgi:hypothetical protein